MKAEKTTVFELVVYKIKDNKVDHYAGAGIDEFRKFALSFPGLKSIKTHTSVKEKGVFMDLVEWESKEDAKKAMEAFEKGKDNPEFAEMMNVFEETRMFEHFNFLK